MRIPGFRAVQAEALDEAAAQLVSCPVCEGYLGNDEIGKWDLRVVRVRSCVGHGYFFIKWLPITKKIQVTWIFDRYMPDLD